MARARENENIRIGEAVTIASGASLEATDGGVIVVGRNFSLGANARVIARRGGRIVIGDDVFLGEGVFVVALESVVIESDALIAEYVVIRDQDHSLSSRPIRAAGFETAPIHIGKDVWIGAKASVLRGAKIGDGAVIGAHAIVKGKISANALAVGAPARCVRDLPR